MTHALPAPGASTGRLVFGRFSRELEAARCTLAAVLIHQDRLADVPRYRYDHSLAVAVDAPQRAFVHYFHAHAPNSGTSDSGTAEALALFPVRTVHTPGVDDLGGLVQPSR